MDNILDLKAIRIGFLSTLYHTSFNLMCNNLIENQLKIKARWELHGTGPSIIEKFLDNKLDIGYIGLPPTIIGINKGAKIKCVAGGHVEGTVMIGTDSIKSFHQVDQKIELVFKQLEGKTIGVAKRGSIHDVMLRHMIKKVGMENSIRVRNYEITDFILIDMENKNLEAAVGTPALATLLTQYLDAKIIVPPSNWWPYNPSYGIIVSDLLINEYPEVVETFVELHKKSCTDLRNKPMEVAKLVEKELEFIRREFILEIYKNSPKYCAALPNEYIQSTMDFVDVLRKLGYVKKEFSVSDIFDLKFIKKIHPEKHHYNDGINLMN